MKSEKIKTVKQLRDLIKDLPDDLPIGTYHANYWNPTFSKGHSMAILPEGLAVDIDYSHDY